MGNDKFNEVFGSMTMQTETASKLKKIYGVDAVGRMMWLGGFMNLYVMEIIPRSMCLAMAGS